MKLTLLTLFAALASSSAFALPSPTDSWEQIRADRSVSDISQGAYAKAFGSDGFFNACVAGDQLHSVAPLRVCVDGKWSGSGGQEGTGPEFTCTAWDSQHVTLALRQVENRCVAYSYEGGGQEGTGAGQCTKYETVVVNIPTVQTFGVYRYGQSGGQEMSGDAWELLFRKEFRIPNCR